jgi:DNA-binding NarL/FixJ family response regulator
MNNPRLQAITIAIVSNNHLVQLGLLRIVETANLIRVVGQSCCGVKAEELILQEKPQVVLIDMEPEIDVTGLIRKVKSVLHDSKIILLCGFEEKERTREAFSSGVDGIVLKVQPPAVLIAAIESLGLGQADPASLPTAASVSTVTGPPRSSQVTEPYPVKWPSALTERERDVIVLIGQGLSNKDIADRLCISGITVRHHLTSIFDKLGVSSRQKLLIRAHQYGLVALTASA